MISVKNVTKVYSDNFYALSNISLDIKRGEIFALLGPNGAGKTTLISCICGLIKQTKGLIEVSNFDTLKDYRKTRSLIGLVPQEFPLDSYESVLNTVNFSRGLFGKKPDENHVKKVLQSLKLWDKKDSPIITLSGGMKRRVLIAKALSHNPKILFLDEPTNHLDIEAIDELQQTLMNLDTALVLVSHDRLLINAVSTRIIEIDRGQLTSYPGSFAEYKARKDKENEEEKK